MQLKLFILPVKNLFAVIGLVLLVQHVDAAGPTVSNVRASQRAGTQLVDVYYDLAVPDSSELTVSVAVSTNGGASYTSGAASYTGALGAGMAPGSNKKITWNAGVDLPAKLFSNVRVSVTASDEPIPEGMALIPAGSFTMGNCMATNEGPANEQPLHTVYVSAFYMDKYEVTKALWDDVYNWAITHGYSFEYGAQGKAANHPAHSMTWHDAVKWCNARSERENITPAFYTDAAQTNVYRSEQVNVQTNWVKWHVGFRLPTEAEWEKAARGGASGHRFPWPDTDTIIHSRANYFSDPVYDYDTSPTRGYHSMFNDGVTPYTSPVGVFAPSGYGLYDMAGNVWEWCSDLYGGYSSGSQTDPRGSTLGSDGLLRGGSWDFNAFGCRTAFRNYYCWSHRANSIGFRSVLPPVGIPTITAQPRRRSVSRGGSATFNVTATGAAPLRYQWRRNGSDIPSATGPSLSLTNVQGGANYSVIVSNDLGIVTSQTARLSVVSGGEF